MKKCDLIISNLVCECGEELDVILTANVTNETGEDSLQIFGWQYWAALDKLC